jgi:site-specific DNA recombinase
VQDRLAARGPGMLGRRRNERRAHLAGILHDGLGRVMTSTHAVSGTRRYRYYATRDATPEQPAWRVSAWDAERLVDEQLRMLLRDRSRIARLALTADPRRIDAAADAAQRIAASPSVLDQAAAIGLMRIDLHEERLEISISERALLGACGVAAQDGHGGTLRIGAAVERVRRGHEIRLVIPGPDAGTRTTRQDRKLIALIADAIDIRDAVLARPALSSSAIASELGKCRKRMTKLLPLAWLAPDVVQAIVNGTQPATLTHGHLMSIDLPIDWDEQRRLLGFT